MAEFCLKCWNALNETNEPADRFIISKELDFCEGCGTWTHVIIRQRLSYTFQNYLTELRSRFIKNSG